MGTEYLKVIFSVKKNEKKNEKKKKEKKKKRKEKKYEKFVHESFFSCSPALFKTQKSFLIHQKGWLIFSILKTYPKFCINLKEQGPS